MNSCFFAFFFSHLVAVTVDSQKLAATVAPGCDMVVSKKVHCAHCQKKCSGNVLRYQDQYYHKQCFELEQSELAAAAKSSRPEPYVDSTQATSGTKGDFRNSHQDEQVVDGVNLKHSSSQQIFTDSKHLSTMTDTNGQQLISSSNNRHNLSGSKSSQHQFSPMANSQSGTTKSHTIGGNQRRQPQQEQLANKSATLPHSASSPVNGFIKNSSQQSCAGCGDKIRDGQALIALDLHWHIWCFKCTQCKAPLHGEYVAKDGKAYCERDYQKLFGITCVYCKRYITGKVLQAGEAHHFHPSCARCSKCGDPFVPGEEMYLQGEVTWHPRCGPGPDGLMAPGDDYDESNRSQVSI